MVHLQHAVDMHLSRFVNWKNSGISPTTILPLFLPYLANVTISKETSELCMFFFNLELCFKLRLFSKDIHWFWRSHIFTACGGYAFVTFCKLKKFWYFTDNHITLILTISCECYDIKRNVGIVYVIFNLELFFKLRLFSRDIPWFWLWQKL